MLYIYYLFLCIILVSDIFIALLGGVGSTMLQEIYLGSAWQGVLAILSVIGLGNSESKIFTFSKQFFNESLEFAQVHSLMNYKKMIDSCQAHMPVIYASNIELIRQKWYWCCD